MPGISLRGAAFRFALRRTIVRRLLLQVLALYLVVGVLAARAHHSFAEMAGMRSIVAALLAVVAWPLVLLGVDLDLR